MAKAEKQRGRDQKSEVRSQKFVIVVVIEIVFILQSYPQIARIAQKKSIRQDELD